MVRPPLRPLITAVRLLPLRRLRRLVAVVAVVAVVEPRPRATPRRNKAGLNSLRAIG
jgi:hypothetical protein